MPVRISLTNTNNVVKRNISDNWTPIPKRRVGSAKVQLALLSILLIALSSTPCVSGFWFATLPVHHYLQHQGYTPCLALAEASETERTLGLLTFDLDDTLFPVSEVVHDANEKMVTHLQTLGFPTSVADFLETTRAVRKLLHQPITYTALRKLAIEAEMKRLTSIEDRCEGMPSLVDECYQVWEHERHAAAERYLFAETIPMLQSIKQAYPDACIAAITNGKGNPLNMHALAKFFEFCVSGEDESVFPNRKPHAGIYEATLTKYRALYADHAVESHIWCHVGDCLANDVGGSAACGAYSVWYAPEAADKSSRVPVSIGSSYRYSTASRQDVEERKKLALAAEELVATRIHSLADLSAAIAGFL
ncbi:hypothetical protein MPSEU_000598900 [Mayamaea pseudoterrestris]|nr:hypothetical protein MPSEU_000598900 [Mayamaea pseudoterrestris]